MMALKSLAHALGGDVVGQQVLCPGPGHSPQDRSLSVMLRVAAPDGFIVHSHAGDDWRDCRDYVLAKLGRSDRGRYAPARKQNFEGSKQRAVEDNSALACNLWDEARNPYGTVVENYLASRSLRLPAEIAHEVVRFHPRCPWRGDFQEIV